MRCTINIVQMLAYKEWKLFAKMVFYNELNHSKNKKKKKKKRILNNRHALNGFPQGVVAELSIE